MTRVGAFLCLLITAATGQQVRVLSYNIHHGEGTDARFDLMRIAKVISAVSPDLVALQEVDVRTKRSGDADLALEMGRLAGMYVVFGRTIDHEGGLYGNAVLSRWPLNGFANHVLPSSPGREHRGVIEAHVQLPAPFTFWATHLDVSEADRVLAARALRDLTRRDGDPPMLLAGDLNAVVGSEPMKILLADWNIARLDAPLLTFPADTPARQIDYVLYRPASRWRVVEARVLADSVASDHRAMFAVLEITR